jgi:hypothetical protein
MSGQSVKQVTEPPWQDLETVKHHFHEITLLASVERQGSQAQSS